MHPYQVHSLELSASYLRAILACQDRYYGFPCAVTAVGAIALV